jgi:hypothetical protein
MLTPDQKNSNKNLYIFKQDAELLQSDTCHHGWSCICCGYQNINYRLRLYDIHREKPDVNDTHFKLAKLLSVTAAHTDLLSPLILDTDSLYKHVQFHPV